jgi:hypothetical protein
MNASLRLDTVAEFLEEVELPLDSCPYVPILLAQQCDALKEDGLEYLDLGAGLEIMYGTLSGPDALGVFFDLDDESLLVLFGTEEDPHSIRHVIDELQW